MKKKNLRSQQWFDNPKDPEQTAIYLERYLNYGLTRKELQSGNPIIGIAQSGSDLTPCNRHFQSLSKRIKGWNKKSRWYSNGISHPSNPRNREKTNCNVR